MVNKDPLLESNQEGVESTQSDFPSYLGNSAQARLQEPNIFF